MIVHLMRLLQRRADWFASDGNGGGEGVALSSLPLIIFEALERANLGPRGGAMKAEQASGSRGNPIMRIQLRVNACARAHTHTLDDANRRPLRSCALSAAPRRAARLNLAAA